MSDFKKIPVLVFFLAVLGVYMGTLLAFFPNMPVIARMAEEIPGFQEHYPPFQFDEYSYHTISKSILNGNIYNEDSLERGLPAGFSFVSAPFVAVFDRMGGYFANLLIIWLCVILFYILARRYAGIVKSLLITAILAFCTLNYYYASSSYTEPLSQLIVIGAFLLLTMENASALSLVFAGILTALNLFVRPHYIILALPFFFYLVGYSGRLPRFTRGNIYFTAGVFGVGILWVIRNIFIFGGPIEFEYSRLYGSFIPGQESAYLKGNIFVGIHRLLFDEYKGLFTITPVFLLFIPGLRSMWLKGYRRETWLVFASVFIMTLLFAASPYPFTEFGLGSRHMVPIVPLLIFPLVFFLDKGVFVKSVAAVAAVYSFWMAGIGWFTGGEPGKGFFLGILNDAHARAIVLARKDLLDRPEFATRDDLLAAWERSLRDSDMELFLKTLDRLSIDAINGQEREVFRFLRTQANRQMYILSADPKTGIVLAVQRKEQ